jgi:hypothetical protein
MFDSIGAILAIIEKILYQPVGGNSHSTRSPILWD